MIPALSYGLKPQQRSQPISNVVIDHQNLDIQTLSKAGCSQYEHMQVQEFQPFNITIYNNSHYYQQPIRSFGSSVNQGILAQRDVKSEPVDQNDTTTAVMAALHPNHTWAQYPVATQNKMPAPDQTTQSQPSRSPLGELRLPPIKTTANVAANVMSEETDLGYVSFSDISTIQEFPEVIDYSDVSDDMLDDVKSNFSDIIDDVLDAIDNNSFEKSETLGIATESIKTEPPQTGYTHAQIYGFAMEKENYYEHLNFQNVPVPAVTRIEPRFMTPVINTNVDTRQAYCQLCDKYLQTKANLRVHMRQHRGDRPHQCPYCDKLFTQKSTLRTHVRTHTGERPYVCQFCARAFSDYSTYRKHVRVHTGEKPYTCDVCKKSFTQSGNMIRHREVHFRKSEKRSKQ